MPHLPKLMGPSRTTLDLQGRETPINHPNSYFDTDIHFLEKYILEYFDIISILPYLLLQPAFCSFPIGLTLDYAGY